MKLKSLIIVGLAAACIAVSARADADEAPSAGTPARVERATSREAASAAREFLRGQQAFEQADYRTAGQAFEAAYAAKPHHDALFNAGQSWQRAGDEIRAANLLDHYLRDAPANAPDRAVAESMLADVAKRAGRVRLELVDVRRPAVDGEPVGPGVLFVSPGEHAFTGETTEGQVRRAFRVRAGELTSVDTATLDGPTVPVTKPGAAQQGAKLSPWIVAVGGGLVGLGAVATTVFGLDAVEQRDAYLQSRTQERYDAVADAQSRTNVTLYGTLGLLVVTGVVALLFVDWRSPARGAASSTVVRVVRTGWGAGPTAESTAR